ncbi:acyl-CoA thioesterase [Leptothoe kymatousa]|uniref:1,4-dihydroxy-2-naphthoyl-CoA hydrolase n=1 Tax=Leptothoe kymatousa TAU-MAC 1615 TaxID=2364775 RepID=A0ABS5Y2A1_9CYAN|nr:acyl-CoA thioesterase [Leptothoe kymatousa]MBT9311922.1 acyl-CoA thioesterase [Leptothoe kymatousa TAU-MAC 1615]
MAHIYSYRRTIRFHETDGAGVVYFANVLTLCHEAYEAALGATGIDLRRFFGGGSLAVPVVHGEVDFRRPLHCGDEVAIALAPQPIDGSTFEIRYTLSNGDQKTVATALTRHVCIDSASRQRHALDDQLQQWIRAAKPPSVAD